MLNLLLFKGNTPIILHLLQHRIYVQSVGAILKEISSAASKALLLAVSL